NLYLNGRDLTREEAEAIHHTDSQLDLHLSQVRFQEDALTTLGTLTNVHHITLSRCTPSDLKTVKLPQGLTILSIQSMRNPREALTTPSSLEELEIGDLDITPSELEALSDLQRLRKLMLFYMQPRGLTDAVLEQLVHLPLRLEVHLVGFPGLTRNAID